MWKFHKKSKIEVLAVILFVMAVPACASEKCLYKKVKPVKVAGAIAQVRQDESTSYLLKDGSFLRVTTWDCSRLGKRIALTIAAERDNAGEVMKFVLPLVSSDVRSWLAKAIEDSNSKNNYATEGDIQAYQSAVLSVERGVYSSTYVVEYFTPD